MTHVSRIQLIIEGKTGNPLSVVNEHRRRAGLPPFEVLPERESIPRVVHAGTARSTKRIAALPKPCVTCKTPPVPEGPGTELKAMLKSMGVPPCQLCDQAAKEMDALGVAGCRAAIEERVTEMLPRTMEWIATNRPWVHALLPNVVQEIEARRRLRNLITTAIDTAEAKAKEKTERTIKAARTVRHHRQYASTQVVWADAGDPIFQIRTAVRVANRRSPTINGTIASLKTGGFEPPTIYAEPDAPEIDGTVIRWHEKKGAFRSFVAMCRDLLNGPDGWLLLCEDDVELKAGCADYLRTLNLTKEQAVSLYVSAAQDSLLAGDGLNVTRGDMHGSLAYFVHSSALRQIIDSKTVTNWKGDQRVDRAFCQAAEECGVQILCPRPALAQHTGLTSTLVRGRKLDVSRSSQNFRPERHQTGLVTLITPTGDRPEAFTLCERWIKQQRYTGPVQWIVIDDGRTPTNVQYADKLIHLKPMPGHSLCRNLRAAVPYISGEYVFVIEDDDYYGPDYLSTMVGRLQHADLVGEFGAKYYYIRESRYRHRLDEKHSSLCRTGMRNSVIPALLDCVNGTEHPSVDLRLWERWTGSAFSWVDESGDSRMCVGIKGVNGRPSNGWRVSHDSMDDRNGQVLNKWISNDARYYSRKNWG